MIYFIIPLCAENVRLILIDSLYYHIAFLSLSLSVILQIFHVYMIILKNKHKLPILALVVNVSATASVKQKILYMLFEGLKYSKAHFDGIVYSRTEFSFVTFIYMFSSLSKKGMNEYIKQLK